MRKIITLTPPFTPIKCPAACHPAIAAMITTMDCNGISRTTRQRSLPWAHLAQTLCFLAGDLRRWHRVAVVSVDLRIKTIFAPMRTVIPRNSSRYCCTCCALWFGRCSVSAGDVVYGQNRVSAQRYRPAGLGAGRGVLCLLGAQQLLPGPVARWLPLFSLAVMICALLLPPGGLRRKPDGNADD